MIVTTELERRYINHLKILQKIDDTLSSKVWNKNKVLQSIESEVKALRKVIDSSLNLSDGYLLLDEHGNIHRRKIDRVGYEEVYVIVENKDISLIQNWEPIIKNINQNNDIYKYKADAKSVIDKKANPNLGFLNIYVKKGDIKEVKENTIRDKMGFELYCIKDNAIKQKNIMSLIFNSNEYQYMYGKLFFKKK